MNYIRYNIWPILKVRLRYFWWIIKYGGKKNIPRELVFEQVVKNMSNLTENLMGALRHIPDNIDEKEKRELIDLIREAGELEKEFEKARSSKP